MRRNSLVGDVVGDAVEENGEAGGGDGGGEDLHVAEAREEVERKEGTHEDADHRVESGVKIVTHPRMMPE